MKYNYVIFATDDDYYKVSYNELLKNKGVKYIGSELDSNNKLLTFFYKMHTSPLTNKFVNLPFKNIWNCKMFTNTFEDNKPICFIFFPGRRKEYDNGLMTYLKKKYKDSKFILYYQDMIGRSKMPEIELFKKEFDLILSFDHSDVLKYNLNYYPLVYSEIDVPNVVTEESDVYFVGKAKNRLEDIRAAHKLLKNAGLKCDFHVTGVATEDIRDDGIIYNMSVSYMENLQRIKKTKCMLEIMQKGGHGYTLRYCEAIMYDKKIITNNPEVEKAPFYSKERIQVVKRLDDIDAKFVLSEPINVDYHYKDKLSPLKLIEYIENEIK